MSRWAALILLLAGCTPEFDRCRIPGTPGCGPADGAVGPGCPDMPASAPLFVTAFDDVTLDRFELTGDAAADWAIEEGELRQRNRRARGASALVAGLELTDVWVTGRMRRIEGSGGGAIELTVRADGDSYHCNWEPGTGELEIQRDSMRSALVSTRVDLAAIDGYDPSLPVTMEMSARGSELRCCLRELGAPSLTVFDDGLTTGSAGARTYEIAGAFETLEVREAR